MADGTDLNKNTEGVSHPFAVEEDRKPCSAFSVVTRSKGQPATARAKRESAAAKPDAIKTEGQKQPGSKDGGQVKNADKTTPVRTRNRGDVVTPNNNSFDIPPGGQLGVNSRTSSPPRQTVSFRENPRDPGAHLRIDAIGPGVILESLVTSNWGQNSTNFNENSSRSETSDRPLRRRGIRSENVSNSDSSNCSRQQHNGYNSSNRGRNVVGNRHRLANDLELLSRPSWCDAHFAYEQVRQGKASGSRGSLWFRSVLHRFLFRLGCYIQRRAGFILVPCLLLLIACSVIGLKFRTLETRVEKLWVESGGVLEKELEYTRSMVGEGMESSLQILIQTGEDTATVESLKLHLKAAVAATKITVRAYDQDWELSDLCYKELPDLGETNYLIEQIIGKIFPCLIIGPLDCFYEGAELLGPSTPIPAFPYGGIEPFTWKTLNPKELFEGFGSNIPDVNRFAEMVSAAGVEYGYQDRWCLDPYNPDCPAMAPNKMSKEIPDVKSLLSAGCEGYATKYMKWPNDLIVGGIEKNKAGNITRARGLQTIIHLMGPTNMYNFHNNNIKVQKWNLEKATNILTMFQRKFVQEMYNILINASSFPGKADELHAFAPSTTEDLIQEFSSFSLVRVAAGYILMLLYACFTMLRCKASRSQGAVGVTGVVLVALSVMAGLGTCSFIGIKFNAATTQVLPFLMLGLGVDDMFLIAHQFGEIACLNYIPFEERTGECLKRVGVSVLLTSVAILSGFLFSMIIPMPALRSFALQAAIITCFNLLCVLLVFPATLSIDLVRRRKNKLDIFCCFQSSSANDVVELSDYGHDLSPPRPRPPPVARFTNLPAAPHQQHVESEATFTMHHTIQAFSNESYVTFLGPAAETTFSSNGHSNAGPGHPNFPPMTPPPRYTPDGRPIETPEPPPMGPRQAFQQPTPVTADNPAVIRTDTSTSPPLKKPAPSTPRTGTSNLVTPMESVRSSTHSLVPAARSRAARWFNWGRGNPRGANYTECFPLLTLSDFAKKYYSPFLMKTPTKATVLVICGLLCGASIYGCLLVRDGLDLVDILPRGTREHDAMSAQLKYFSFYNMYLTTKEFDYAHKQKELHMLHHNISELRYVVKNTDGTRTKFWLEYMREWLQNLQAAFDYDWSQGYINETTWKPQASDEGVMAFKLLLQTGKLEDTTDWGRIGCAPPNNKPCQKVNIVRLVSDDGIIREDGFYNYLTAWTQNDPLAYLVSQAQIIPTPETWESQRSGNLIVSRSKAITYAQMPYYLNDLRENEDFVDAIKSVRSLCEHYEAEGVLVYPDGYPFLFWQQYIDLRKWLFLAMGTAILGISSVVALALLSLWAGGITCMFLVVITTQLLGFMGFAGVKLSALPAVILIAAIGLGVEFTVHVTLAFLTSCGSRDDRTKSALGHMMGPVVDGAVSTFLGVVMLSGSEFDFIIRYFFQVLAVLVLIGLWNGIVVLPVVLSFMGPPPEVVPRGGGNRLKTPTPPPTPSIEDDGPVCPNCNNNSGSSRYPRFRQDCYGHYSSRDDLEYMQRPYPSEGPYPHGSRPCYPRYPPRSGYHYPVDPRYQCQVNHGYCHPHSTGNSGSSTPGGPTRDDSRVVIYPDFVLYSPRQQEQPRMQHCDSPMRVSSNQENIASNQRPPDQRRDEGANEPGTSRHTVGMGQHIATVTSSFTVKMVPPRHQALPAYLQPSSNTGIHSSTDSSTLESKFQPIPDHRSQSTMILPEYEDARESANFSESIRISPNIDEASERVDSILQKWGNNDVTG